MGNCMETYTMRQQDGTLEMQQTQQQQQQQQEEETRTSSGFVKVNDNKGANGQRMKIVLTREELKWLILQLNEKGGGMRLEQVLEEIERGREKVTEGWKPSLESILEAPEMLEIN